MILFIGVEGLLGTPYLNWFSGNLIYEYFFPSFNNYLTSWDFLYSLYPYNKLYN